MSAFTISSYRGIYEFIKSIYGNTCMYVYVCVCVYIYIYIYICSLICSNTHIYISLNDYHICVDIP